MRLLRRRVVFVGSAILLSVAAACSEDSTEAPPYVAGRGSSVADAGSVNSDGSVSPNNDAGTTPSDSGAPQSEDAATTAQEKLICDALASRSACAGGAVPCGAVEKCVYGKVMLAEAASIYATCRGAPSCMSDDACVDQAGQSLGGAAVTKYLSDCSARRIACSNTFGDEYCSPSLFAYPGAGPGAQSCLGEECDKIDTCLLGLQALKDKAACEP